MLCPLLQGTCQMTHRRRYLLITPIGRGWYQTDQLHQIVGYFHVLANISVICWLTYQLLWTTVDQGIGRYVNLVSVICWWFVGGVMTDYWLTADLWTIVADCWSRLVQDLTKTYLILNWYLTIIVTETLDNTAVANPQDTWSDSSTYSHLHKTLPYKLCILIYIRISGQLSYGNLFHVQRVSLTGKLPLYVRWDSSDWSRKR